MKLPISLLNSEKKKGLNFGGNNMTDKIEEIELEEFVRSVFSQIESGAQVGERSFKDAIEFEVTVSKTQKLGGNVKIYVASGGGEVNKESVARIKFQVYPKLPEERFGGITHHSDQ